PSYPQLRLALPSPGGIAARIEAAKPDAIHIATEGPIGHMTRAYCVRRRRPFTTSYTTRFPEYIAARYPIPVSWSYGVLRWFHAAASVTMVSTPSLYNELRARNFVNLGMWTRGVDTDVFRPDRAIALELPGTKLVIGGGPQLDELKQRYPEAVFLGELEHETLAGYLAAADVFVFPSKTDTFGIVQLEALACG